MHFFIFWGGFTEFPTPHEIQISSVMGGGEGSLDIFWNYHCNDF